MVTTNVATHERIESCTYNPLYNIARDTVRLLRRVTNMTHSASFDASDACATRQNSRFFTRTPLRTQCAHVISSPPHGAESMSLDKSNAGVARGSAAGFWGSDGWRQGWFMCEVCTRASYGAAQGQGGANGAGQMRQQALAAQALKSLERSCRAFLFASPPFICRKDRKEYFSLLTDLPCSVLHSDRRRPVFSK